MAKIKEFIVFWLNKCFNSLFFLIGFALLLVGLYFYFGLGSSARDALIEQMLHREQANARTGASAIGTFFDLVGKSVARISSRDEVISPGNETDEFFSFFVKQWENTPVTSIILLDEAGTVTKAAYTEIAGGVGASLKDRGYFIWAKTAEKGEYYISETIKSRLRGENYFVVVVASPIKDENGNFKGALLVGISVTRLTEQYLTHLKISDATEIYLVRTDGTLLYTPFKELLGENMFDYIKAHPFLGSEVLLGEIRKRMEDVREGKALFAYPEKAGAAFPLKSRMLAYSPVPVTGQDWILVIATPVEDALISMGPIYLRFLIGLLIVFLILLAMGIRLAKILAYREMAKKAKE